MQGLGLEAKNPNGNWTLEEHLVNGSSKTSWSNDPFISTTSDLNCNDFKIRYAMGGYPLTAL